MNAVVSGQAGVALLVNGSELASIHAGRSGEIVRRSPAEARFLLGDAGDLQFLEDVEVDEVIQRLELASAQMDAFHTALILLDGSLPPETRQIAAEELQEFLEDEMLSHFVESVLFAHPLTRDSDIPGALSRCTPRTEKTLRFLCQLVSLQEAIAEVHQAWEWIAIPIFGREEDRNTARAVAVREGLFRSLALCRDAHGSVDQFLADALRKSEMKNHGEILTTWVGLLREKDDPVCERRQLVEETSSTTKWSETESLDHVAELLREMLREKHKIEQMLDKTLERQADYIRESLLILDRLETLRPKMYDKTRRRDRT